jgi:glycine cleavage system pyridoxal-binding protein P
LASYVPNTKEERQAMLEDIGYSSFADLYKDIPEQVRLTRPLNLPQGLTEMEVSRRMSDMAAKNRIYRSIFRGAGSYHHYIPAMVGAVLSKENFQTTYTPYQAEISQGVLQSIFEYQTLICDLTDMDVSNASVYDGSTAAAEAVVMCDARKRHKAIISGLLHPNTIEVIKTYVFGNGLDLVIIPEKDGRTDLEALKAALDDSTASVLVQSPNYLGNVEDCQAIGQLAHEAGAKFIMSVNPMSLGTLKTPGECDADVACGDCQPLGLPMAFGGPYVGFMAAKSSMMRHLPGRIVGQTKDDQGRVGYVLTLQAREQHIRREKASSNICSNQALCAMAVTVYLASMGNKNFIKASQGSMNKAHYLAQELAGAGLATENTGFFYNEFVTVSQKSSKDVLAALDAQGILGGLALDDHRILWCCTEMNSKADMDEVVRIVKEVG